MRVWLILWAVLGVQFISVAPSAVHAGTISSIGAGGGFGCLIKDGQVWCWGNNSDGQLGDRSTTDRIGAVRTQKNNGTQLINVTSISTGRSHACAVSGGNVWCWGNNSDGQLGDNTITNRTGAVRVNKSNGQVLTGATFVSVGELHSCAISNQSVWCWGNNSDGQLGNRTTANQLQAVQVVRQNGAAFTQVTALDAGVTHTCAVSASQAFCWGENSEGQLGDNSTVRRTGAVNVKQSATQNLINVTAISAGTYHSCAIQNRQAMCWGNNSRGQIGDNTRVNRLMATASRKTNNTPINNAQSISAGELFSCAVNNGELWCWGRNNTSQLGNATHRDSARAVRVINASGAALTRASTVSAGATHACAIINNTPWCWGEMQSLATSIETPLHTSAVIVKKQSQNVNLSGALRVTSGVSFSCTSDLSNAVWCWGLNHKGQLGNRSFVARRGAVQVYRSDNTLLSSVHVQAGNAFACAIVGSTKQVWCWGDNSSGQLGDGTTTNRNKAVQVKKMIGNTSLTNVTNLAVGTSHACAVTSAGAVFCWGSNSSGQLGDSTTTAANKAVQVRNGSGTLANARMVSAGENMSCAVVESNRYVKCWGHNRYGQLGNGTNTNSLRPVSVYDAGTGLVNGVKMISSGNQHTCVVDANNDVSCWGYNAYGQIGDGTTTHRSLAQPAQFAVGGVVTGTATIIDAGFDSSCAAVRFLSSTTWQMFCWGRNDSGQLSDTSTTNRTSAVPLHTISGTSQSISFAAPGYNHICVSEATLTYCAGTNEYGQIGNRATLSTLGAIRVRYVGGALVE